MDRSKQTTSRNRSVETSRLIISVDGGRKPRFRRWKSNQALSRRGCADRCTTVTSGVVRVPDNDLHPNASLALAQHLSRAHPQWRRRVDSCGLWITPKLFTKPFSIQLYKKKKKVGYQDLIFQQNLINKTFQFPTRIFQQLVTQKLRRWTKLLLYHRPWLCWDTELGLILKCGIELYRHVTLVSTSSFRYKPAIHVIVLLFEIRLWFSQTHGGSPWVKLADKEQHAHSGNLWSNL